MLKVGDRVNWIPDADDPCDYEPGTVTEVEPSGMLTVKWDDLTEPQVNLSENDLAIVPTVSSEVPATA